MTTELKEPMDLGTALIYGLIASLLVCGLLIALTPKSDFSCDPQRRLAVKPGVTDGDIAAFCVFELPLVARSSLLYSDKSTGECRTSKKEAEAVFREMVDKDRAAFQQCLKTRAAPPEATWNFTKRLVGLDAPPASLTNNR